MSDRIHELKTWPGAFQEVWDGWKTFEVRHDDGRGFRELDGVLLREWVPAESRYTGRTITATVGLVIRGDDFAQFGLNLPGDLALFSLLDVCEAAKGRKVRPA